MKQFKGIYKILKTLLAFNGNSNFSVEQIRADVVGLSECEWEQILIMLQKEGYIEGIKYTQTLSDYYPQIVYPITPRITLKGMEYVEENSMMKKAANIAKGIADMIPGV